MTISGFTFVKNADKLYIPVKESILSVLPLCDEFIVALGDNDPDDKTEEWIASIGSPKIKIVRTVWDTKTFYKNTEFARQTDIAKSHCSGDWLFYIQSDEAIHENDHEKILKACKDNLNKSEVEGFLFKYYHFWGDYNHVHKSHAWYKREIRIIRNDNEVHSWKDAQSFRKYPNGFIESYKDYQRADNNRKLNVLELDAHVYHYGYARPPQVMTGKKKTSFSSYHGDDKAKQLLKDMPDTFDYGPLNRIPKFKGTHPAVMKDWMARFNWADELQLNGAVNKSRLQHGHERLKYRVLTFIENTFLGGRTIWDFKNYNIIKRP